MSEPAVSVVIASYDSADYAERAVASVLGQTYRDFEVVLVDDGSAPPAAAILDRLASEERVRLLRQPNRGCFRARRHGWEQARGRLVAFLDDDDRYLPHYLETCVPHLERDPRLGGVYSRFYLVDAAGRRNRTLPRRGYPGRGFAQEARKGSVKTSTLMVRREALLRLSGILEHFKSTGDYDIVLRLRHDHPFAFVPEPLVEVLDRRGSLSKDVSTRHVERAAILENLLRVFPEMRGVARRAVRAKTAKYYAKAGDHAIRRGEPGEARVLYRRSLATRWNARGLRGYLTGAPPSGG